MNKVGPTVAAILVAALLQVSVAPHMAIAGVVPNLLLLVVITLSLIEGPQAGASAGFAAGLMFDLLGTGPIGPAALVLAITGHIAGLMGAVMFAEGWLLPVTVVFLASLATEVSYALVLAILGAGSPFWTTFLHVMLPAAVYNGTLALLFYPLLARFLRREQQMTTFRRLA